MTATMTAPALEQQMAKVRELIAALALERMRLERMVMQQEAAEYFSQQAETREPR